jgi:hypothetical protein
MKPNKLFRISEIMWLVIAIACVITDIIIFIQGQTSKGLFFIGMTAMASIMYFVRRKMRIRAEIVMGVRPPKEEIKKTK